MKKHTVKVLDNGKKEWYRNSDQYHREDAPAIELAEWYRNSDQYHREDAPAIELADRTREGYRDGKLQQGEVYPKGKKVTKNKKVTKSKRSVRENHSHENHP